jgi:hypothetical protein
MLPKLCPAVSPVQNISSSVETSRNEMDTKNEKHTIVDKELLHGGKTNHETIIQQNNKPPQLNGHKNLWR